MQQHTQAANTNQPSGVEDTSAFCDATCRTRLAKQLSAHRPYVYWTLEFYDEANGIKGGGGLGILAADMRRVAERLQVPFVVVTPFYRQTSHTALQGGHQEQSTTTQTPLEHGYQYIQDTPIHFASHPSAQLAVFTKQIGSTRLLTISEPNYGALYAGTTSSDHRLYQQVALGFGGYNALRLAGVRPSVIQLNETATVFAAIARLDELCRGGMNLYEALVYVRKHTIYTNHTLVQAAESSFTTSQCQEYIYPNISSPSVRLWLEQQCRDGQLHLSTLAIELAEAKNGVSRLHSKTAQFASSSGRPVRFATVTNGIDMHHWVLPEIMQLYQQHGVLDACGMPTPDYSAALARIPTEAILACRAAGRTHMNSILAERRNQYNQPIYIPPGAISFDFKRRFAHYKRPDLLFQDPAKLAQLLDATDAYYLIAGNAHPHDAPMQERLSALLATIDADPILRRRVHYIQDYDETVSRALAYGSDIAINIPMVGLEACGTSWEKDIANLKLLISTADGGVADVAPLACLQVTGRTDTATRESVFQHMQQAATLCRQPSDYAAATMRQLTAYLPIISGARMLRDYLQFIFPHQAA